RLCGIAEQTEKTCSPPSKRASSPCPHRSSRLPRSMPETALLTEPTALFALLAAVMGLVFCLSRPAPLKKLFDIAPPVIWAYFIPMLLTTVGVTPAESPTYSWMSRYLLPIALFLLMITVDVPAIMRLGKIALVMMLAGTLGIVVGGP